MYLDRNSETKWLVKTENKILGPYSFDQIVDLIRKKQVSLIDEIRDSETRWLYVRENLQFKNIVEEIRLKTDSGTESTKTFQSISKTVEEVINKTNTDINSFTDINIEAKDLDVVSEVLAAHAETPIQLTKSRIFYNTKAYGVSSDKMVKAKIGTYFKRTVLFFLAAGVIVTVAFFGYLFFQKRGVLKHEEVLSRQIKTYKYLGFNQKAVDLFAQLPIINQKKLIPDLLEIYPLLEAQGLVGKYDIQTFKDNPLLSSEQKAYVELIYFGQALQKNKIEEAQDSLIRATTFLPTSYLIKENDALLALKKGNFLDAFKNYHNIFNQDKNGRYLFGMAQAFSGLSSLDRSQLGKEFLLNIEKYTSVYYDYKKELLLVQIWLSNELNDTVRYKVSKAQFFNTPCRLSDEFNKPGLLAPNSYQWKEIKGISESVQKNLSGDELILFQLHDYLELNFMGGAADFVTYNLTKVNNAAIRAQMNLLLLSAQKRNNEVLALEKLNKLDMASELNHFLIAKNKIELTTKSDIAVHLQFLKSRQQIFYNDWLELEQFVKRKSVGEIKIFLNAHFITTQNFNPVAVAKGLVYSE